MTEERRPKAEAILDYQKSLESKLEEAEKEIERLKGLIEKAYSAGKYAGYHYTGKEEENYWQQFKTDNNI